MHVDDFEFCGDKIFQKEVIEVLKAEFNVGSHEYGSSFKYLGLEISQTKGKIQINQNLYKSTISPIEI